MAAAPARLHGDDSFVVARLVAGDETALAELYDCYGEIVFGVARRITADVPAAEDVVQEVFLHIWQCPAQVDLGRCSLRGWLSVLAHRRAVDWVRRQDRARRREERATVQLDVETPPPVVDLSELVMSADLAARARAAVASLPPDQRTAIELAYFRGHTYREVGAELGIPEGTAKSRMRLGLARLAVLLENEMV